MGKSETINKEIANIKNGNFRTEKHNIITKIKHLLNGLNRRMEMIEKRISEKKQLVSTFLKESVNLKYRIKITPCEQNQND